MKLSLSVRISEKYHSKRESSMSLHELSGIANTEGYSALCMRASQLGIQTPVNQIEEERKHLTEVSVQISMATGDFAIPENTDDAPMALRNITPYLDLAEALETDLLRIGMKTNEDIVWAQRASDEAKERDIRLAHQSHTQSLFETVESSINTLKQVGRTHFGIIYEPANLQLCGEQYRTETIKKLSPYIFNVYLQNQKIHPGGPDSITTWRTGKVNLEHIPIWRKEGINFEDVISDLDQTGYQGYVTVHQAFGGLIEPAKAAKKSASYLKSISTFD